MHNCQKILALVHSLAQLCRICSRNDCGCLRLSVASPTESPQAYTYIFWLPIIINALLKGTALTHAAATTKPGSVQGLLPVLLTSIPYTFGAITTWIAAHSSQKRGELFWHCSINLMLAGILFAIFPVMAGASIAAGFASLVLTVGGAAAANGIGVTIVAEIAKGPSQVRGEHMHACVAAAV